MKLHIENIAKIKKVDIDIDAITVVAGSNNTGKSTVGKALFAVFEAFNNIEQFVQEWKPRDAKKILKKHGGNLDFICKKISGAKRRKVSLVDELQDRFAYWIADCKNDSAVLENMKRYCTEHLRLYGIELEFQNGEVQSWLLEAGRDMVDNMMDYDSEYAKKYGIQKELQEVFGGQICKRTKRDEEKAGTRRSVIEIEINGKDSQSYAMKNTVTLEMDDVKEVNQGFIVDTNTLYIENPRVLNQCSGLGYMQNDEMAKKKMEQLLKPNNGRYTVFSSYYELLNTRIVDEENDIKNAESNVEMQRMDEIIADIDAGLAELMKGTVQFQNANAPLLFKDGDYEEGFQLSNLSTGLKAISLLQCILHYRVLRRKSVLILDEPEINLHPEWQVKYAQFIAMLQKRLELHIVVTTHSPFFLKALENAAVENDIEKHCHYYYAEDDRGDSVLRCVDDDIESVYSKMMMPLFDMIADMGL